MGGVMLNKKATEIEVAIDDEEGLTSISFAWEGPGGYFIITNDPESRRIYCELEDQSNGFYTENIDYFIAHDGKSVTLRIDSGLTFIREKSINEIKIELPEKENILHIDEAMKIISS